MTTFTPQTTHDFAVRPLLWFHFSQNNSGGRFVVNDDVAEDVFFQAPSAKDALVKAHAVLDESAADWCPCCGERWDFYVEDSDGTAVPMIYETPLTEAEETWCRKGAVVYFFDGRKEKVAFKKGGAL